MIRAEETGCDVRAGADQRLPPASSPAWPKWMITVCLAVHVWAACHALPLSAVWDYPVLGYGDFAVHAHACASFSRTLFDGGETWGYDPAICGGSVMLPMEKLGNVIYDVAALLFPHAETGRLVTAPVWCAMLVAPLALLAAARWLALDAEETAWALLVATGFLWLEPAHQVMLRVGMAAFLLSSFLCLAVLAGCDRFLRKPTVLGGLAVVVALSLLLFVHPLAPVAIAPALLWLMVGSKSTAWRSRTVLLAAPLVAALLNAFWLVPVFSGLHAPPAPWMTATNSCGTYWNRTSWHDFSLVTELQVAGVVIFSGIGLAILAQRQPRATTAALGITLAFMLWLHLFGSFWSVTRGYRAGPIHSRPPATFGVALGLCHCRAGSAIADSLFFPRGGLRRRRRHPRCRGLFLRRQPAAAKR